MTGVLTNYEIGQTSGVPTFTYSFTNRANIATLLLNYQRTGDSALPQGTLTAPKTQDTNQTFTPKDYYGGLRDATATLDVATETIVLTSGTTNNLYVGLSVEKLSGTGTFDAGTVVTNIIDSTTFVVSKKPTGSGAVTFEVGSDEFTTSTIGAGMNFFLSGTQTNSQYTFTNTATRSIRWWSRMYWGRSASTAETTYNNLTNSSNTLLTSTGSFSQNVSFGSASGTYLYIYFHSGRTLSSIILNTNNNVVTDSFTQLSNQTITNAYGVSVTYKVYRSVETLAGSDSYTVNLT
jgi:hypothetical protein